MRISRLLSGCMLGLAYALCSVAFQAVEYAATVRKVLVSLPDVAGAVFKATLSGWCAARQAGAGLGTSSLQAISNHFSQIGAPVVSFALYVRRL